MKLLFCGICGDIFNLDYKVKQCSCGHAKGKYLNNLIAVYSGKQAVPLGFANDSFAEATQKPPRKDGLGNRFEAFIIPKKCDTFIKYEEEVI